MLIGLITNCVHCKELQILTQNPYMFTITDVIGLFSRRLSPA